jgi:hypothetical protein
MKFRQVVELDKSKRYKNGVKCDRIGCWHKCVSFFKSLTLILIFIVGGTIWNAEFFFF